MTDPAASSRFRRFFALSNIQAWARALPALEELNRRQIPTIVVKSLPQVEDLYGDIGGRGTSDVDVVIPARRVNEAMEALAALGWAPGPPEQRLLELSRERGGSEAIHSRPWHLLHWLNGHVAVLDLHSDGMHPRWKPALDPGIWERATPTSSDGVEYLLLSPEDRLLFLCNHFLFESGWEVVHWHKLVDIELALRRGAELDWAYLGRRAHRTGTTILLRLVCELAASRATTPLQPLWRSVPVASRWRYALLSVLIPRALYHFGQRARSLIVVFSLDRSRLVLFLLREIFLPSRLTIAANHTGAWPSWPRYLATLANISIRRLRAIARLG